jgi:hypothetical protein
VAPPVGGDGAAAARGHLDLDDLHHALRRQGAALDAATAANVTKLFAATWFAPAAWLAAAALTAAACRLAWLYRGRHLGRRIPREVLLPLLPERGLALSE